MGVVVLSPYLGDYPLTMLAAPCHALRRLKHFSILISLGTVVAEMPLLPPLPPAPPCHASAGSHLPLSPESPFQRNCPFLQRLFDAPPVVPAATAEVPPACAVGQLSTQFRCFEIHALELVQVLPGCLEPPDREVRSTIRHHGAGFLARQLLAVGRRIRNPSCPA